MANECSGVCRVAAKNKRTLDRLVKIMNYEDDEFFVSRCRQFEADGIGRKKNGLFVKNFFVTGANNCAGFFETDEDEKNLICVGYEKDAYGRRDFSRPIYGTAHLTNLVNLAEKLGFGIEMWTCEPGCGFSEHLTVDHEGNYNREVEDYTATYPNGEDGEPDYDSDPAEDYGFEDWGDFANADEIYG